MAAACQHSCSSGSAALHGDCDPERCSVTDTRRTSLEKGAGVDREYDTRMVCPPFRSYSECACASKTLPLLGAIATNARISPDHGPSGFGEVRIMTFWENTLLYTAT